VVQVVIVGVVQRAGEILVMDRTGANVVVILVMDRMGAKTVEMWVATTVEGMVVVAVMMEAVVVVEELEDTVAKVVEVVVSAVATDHDLNNPHNRFHMNKMK